MRLLCPPPEQFSLRASWRRSFEDRASVHPIAVGTECVPRCTPRPRRRRKGSLLRAKSASFSPLADHAEPRSHLTSDRGSSRALRRIVALRAESARFLFFSRSWSCLTCELRGVEDSRIVASRLSVAAAARRAALRKAKGGRRSFRQSWRRFRVPVGAASRVTAWLS